MSTYVDVDTSAEALQEDEELIEAVNQIVEKTAEIIYTDVKNDVSGFYLKLKQMMYTAFPFLVYWKEDHVLFWDDMHKVAITSVLSLLAFTILAPSKLWVKKSSSWLSFGNRSSRVQRRTPAGRFRNLRRLHRFASRSDATESEEKLERRQLQRRRSFSSVDYKLIDADSDDEDDDEEEEKEEERFAKMWPTIASEARYRSLVLPPECRRVDKPQRNYRISTLTEEKKDDNEQGDDENPFDRLVTYSRQFLAFMVSMIRYDFGGAGSTLFHWLESMGRARGKLQKSPEEPEEEENDDDDESDTSSVRNSLGTASALNRAESSRAMKPRGRPRRKRDSIVTQQKHHETVDGSNRIIDESDTNDTIDAPNVPQNSQSGLSTGDEEKKDCIDEFESARDLVEESSIASPPLTPKKSTTTQSFPPKEPPTRKDSFANDCNTPANDRTVHPTTPTTPSDHIFPLEVDSEHATILTLRSRSSGRTKDALKSYQSAPQRKNHVNEKSSLMSSAPESFLPNMRGHVERRGSADGTFYFEAASTDESLRKLAVEIPVPDRNGFILGDDFLEDDESTPLLVFVNSRSGPQQGQLLITQLRGLLNPVQVWDLTNGGPEEVLASFSTFTRLRILVCGGDGTVSWIISTIEKMKLQRWPPIAILPLGTGNDLARVHGWGGGYSNESLIEILEQVAGSYTSWLDRWELVIENKKGKVKKLKSFFNYFGVGADAQMALQVHKVSVQPRDVFDALRH